MSQYEDRDYQTVGTNFLRAMKRAFLTDDPGLGKSVTAIRAVELPCLVVAPKYLTGQWEDAIKMEHEDAVIARADGTRVQRDKILDKTADWYIVNPEMLATYDMPTGIATTINDESHRFRHRNARQSIAAYEVENKLNPGCRIYNLTATPFWKSPSDIWMQAHILYPNVFTSYHNFVKTFCVTVNSPWEGPKVIGIKKAMRGPLRDLLKPIMLGRTYKEVGRYLPDIVESTIHLTLPKELKALYTKLVDDYSITYETEEGKHKLLFEATTVLHALRQITAASGKYDAIKDIILDNNDKPAVIGFWYRDHAAKMHSIMQDESVLVTGDLDAVTRNRVALQAQRQRKHIVATQESLKEGINLSGYRLFIFGEEHYVPESNRQFLTRVVRDRNDGGKDTEPVRVFYVMCRGTIDTTIHSVAKRRGIVISAVREVLDRTFVSHE